MKTKIVYVVVSTERDIYLEQAWVSIFSLRNSQNDAVVEVVSDEETAERIHSIHYIGLDKMIDRVISIPFAGPVSGMERSRFLKTNLRELVFGDFLFLDTDTVITSSLSEVDNLTCNIGMVYDWHCPLSERPNQRSIRRTIKSLFGIELKPETNYFNSGSIYCKDSQESHTFFQQWHKNWLATKDMRKGMQDQQSLAVTVDALGGVSAIPGDYNCQVLVGFNYLVTAKVVHFFNLRWSDYILSPLLDKHFFSEIKHDGRISDEKRQVILNCRSTFISPILPIVKDDILLWRSPTFKLIRKTYRSHKVVFRIINKISTYFL